MFLLVPAHPGSLGQNPESHKMVVVVVVLAHLLATKNVTEMTYFGLSGR